MLNRVVTALAAISFAVASAAAWSQAKDIRWGTGPVGSVGHKSLVVLADLLNKEMPKYRITVLPTAGAVTTVKGFATGEYDGFYGSDITFHEIATDSGRFKGFKPNIKRMPVQSLWTFTIEGTLGVKASDAGRYKSWADFAGKRLFTCSPPFDVRAHLERALAALGIKFQYVPIDLSTAGSQLQAGTIDAICIYTGAESTPPPWLSEASLAVDWAAVNPSADEIAKLKKQGFTTVELSPTVFKRDVHVSKVTELPFFFGFDVGLNVPADDVYQMLNIIEKHAAELAKSDSGFAQLAKDMAGFQRRGVESSWDLVPIHPGLAKWMREKGVWDAKWDSKIAK